MKVANVVIQNSFEELAGETRKVRRTFARVASLEVTSVATEANFVPLAEEISLGDQDNVISVLPVQPGFDFLKDAKLTNLKAVDLAKLKSLHHLEFLQKRFTSLAVVQLPAGKIVSHDAYRQSESYGPQVALLPVWGETELPIGAKIVGLVEVEGHAIAAQDYETGDTYSLGYSFESEDPINWVDLAFTRRKHWKRSNRNDGSDTVKGPQYSSFRYTTDDAQVIARVRQKFGRGRTNVDESVTFTLPSQEAYEACESIALEVTRLRQKAVIERDFAAQEALR